MAALFADVFENWHKRNLTTQDAAGIYGLLYRERLTHKQEMQRLIR